MFIKNAPSFLLDPGLVRRQLLLILCRLCVVLFITLTGWRFEEAIGFSFGSLKDSPALLVVTVLALTAGYLVWLRFGRFLTLQIRTELFIDVLLVTWLVWQTGIFISPYGALYVILISLAGLFLGRTDALSIAAACAICFTVLALFTPEPVLYSITGQVAPSSTSQTIAFNDAAFLVVGLLAARIAERRKIGEALKEAEANFADLRNLHERILFSINSGLITTDLHGKIFAFNRAAEEMTGRKSSETLGQNVTSVLGDALGAEMRRCLSRAKSADFLPTSFEAEVEAPDGRRLTLSLTVLPLIAAGGAVTGAIVAFHDRTQLTEMEQRLRRSDRLAAMGRLAAGLAHEVRNPMGAMSSALQYLSEKGKADPECAQLMDVVLRESERLNSIITNFLSYAAPRTVNDPKNESAEIDVGEAISDCLALLRHDPAVHKGHVIDFHPAGGRVMMRGDGSQFKQIVWNLLRNSIRAMPDGGHLSVDVIDIDPKQVRVVVSDTGCGIAADQMQRIFEPFHSGSNGTGLGLSIVHRIVTESGGHINVRNRPQGGTSFMVDLPK